MTPLLSRRALVPAFLSAVCVRAHPGETPAEFGRRLSAELDALAATPVLVLLFGRTDALAAAEPALDCPVLAVEGQPCHAGPLAGAQVFTCASGTAVHRVRRNGQTLAMAFDDGTARHGLFVAGPGPVTAATSQAVQAERSFATTEATLRDLGFDFADLVRTWFYNERLLDWYRDFNLVRNAYYARSPFRSGALPASTAIAGRYADGAALGFAGWVVRPHTDSAHAHGIASPLQCPAPDYGSAFSRALEVASAGHRRLSISGTASIAPGGESLWPGDTARQIEQTMEVVAALLHSRQLTWTEVDRATAYFKHPADLAVFEDSLRCHGLADLPFLPLHADICRDELLFELEVDAVGPGTETPAKP